MGYTITKKGISSFLKSVWEFAILSFQMENILPTNKGIFIIIILPELTYTYTLYL